MPSRNGAVDRAAANSRAIEIRRYPPLRSNGLLRAAWVDEIGERPRTVRPKKFDPFGMLANCNPIQIGFAIVFHRIHFRSVID